MAQFGQSARLGAVRSQVRILLPRFFVGFSRVMAFVLNTCSDYLFSQVHFIFLHLCIPDLFCHHSHHDLFLFHFGNIICIILLVYFFCMP